MIYSDLGGGDARSPFVTCDVEVELEKSLRLSYLSCVDSLLATIIVLTSIFCLRTLPHRQKENISGLERREGATTIGLMDDAGPWSRHPRAGAT